MLADGIIFDIDGTLWNATPSIRESWRLYALGHGMPFDKNLEEFKACMGKPMDAFAEAVFGKLTEEQLRTDIPAMLQFENEYLATHPGDIYPGVQETIRALSEKLTVTIVSNCQAGYIETFIRAAGLDDYVKDWESFGATGLQKADNIRLVVERNGFAHPVYVGDIQADADAAHRAGVPIIHAAYGFGTISDADGRIHAFPELLTLVEPAV